MDYQQLPTLDALEGLIQQGEIEPTLLRTIIDGFARNKVLIIEEVNRSLSSTLKRAINLLGAQGVLAAL